MCRDPLKGRKILIMIKIKRFMLSKSTNLLFFNLVFFFKFRRSQNFLKGRHIFKDNFKGRQPKKFESSCLEEK